MKIRIKGNSIRLRLTKSEVAEFADKGVFFEETNFGSSRLTYGLEISKDGFGASFENGNIIVSVPGSKGREWSKSDEMVGFEHKLTLERGSDLTILVEKDFVCLTDRPNEDESDNYPNPMSHC